MNQVQHQQVNQQLNVASIGSGATGRLRTRDAQGNNLKMPLVQYSLEEWVQSSSTQKSSIRKRRAATDGERCGNHSGGCSRCGGGNGGVSGDRKRQHENRCNHDPKSAEYRALAASVATLSQNINVMAVHMSGRSDEDDDAKPPTNGKMASNAKNSALCKTPKKEKE